ncbi:MAG: hypothetical protein EOO10_25780 [Chitinophagaceae bacterium]|nr:MAG: hypothetical protein EOO10_25780 [Chitinophagaceae bacterium]
MSKSFLFNCFYIFLFAVTIGCKQDAKVPIIKTNLHPDQDGVIRDIPPDHKTEHKQLLKQKTEKTLGLSDLQNGSKGLEIRIYDGEGMTYQGRLFLLRNEGSVWKGELYYYRDSISHAGEEGVMGGYEGATAIEKHELKQTSGEWNDFVNQLFELDIDKLRDYSLIPKYSLGSDEGGVLVEIAQDKFYKIYQMPTPSAREERIKDAKQIVQILELIDQKFGNKLKDSTYSG